MVTAVSTGLQVNLIAKLQQTGNEQKKSFTKLATGKQVASGTGDTNNLVKIGALDAAIRGLEAGSGNAGNNSTTIGVASGGLQQTLTNLQSLRESAVQAADDTLSGPERGALTSKAQETLNAISATAQQTTAGDGQALLDGTFTNKSVQTGPDAGQTTSYSVASVSTQSLGINSIDLSTSAGASSAIGAIDTAISQVTSQMATLGSKQQALDTVQDNNNSTSENLQSSKSKLEDLDYAQAVGEIKMQTIKQKSQIQTLALLNTKDKNNLTLLA